MKIPEVWVAGERSNKKNKLRRCADLFFFPTISASLEGPAYLGLHHDRV